MPKNQQSNILVDQAEMIHFKSSKPNSCQIFPKHVKMFWDFFYNYVEIVFYG